VTPSPATGDDQPDADEHWTGHDRERAEREPWWVLYDDTAAPGQEERHEELGARPGYLLHPSAFVAEGAHVVASRFTIGELSCVAAGCVIRGEVSIGRHCSLNAGAVTIGKVTIGDAVRIAAYAVLVGENHVFSDPDTPIALQGLTTEGVVIEDDVWIGANVTVVDGVTIGAHSVVAAGAVVTRDVEPYSVVAGVPARRLRDRRDAPRPRGTGLDTFDTTVRSQWYAALERCEAVHDGEATYVDTPGAPWGPRPLNDAIEVAAAFGEVPPVASRAELIERLRSAQDPATGLFTDPRLGPPADPLRPSVQREWDMYGLLSNGYALEVLGAGPLHPVHAVEQCSPDELGERLDGLDMEYLAWPSGSWIDGFATGIHLNRTHHGSTDDGALLWGWLLTHQHRESGMWGVHLDPFGDHHVGWLMAVNGFYRLTRGTYAQFGVEVPRAEAAIDTVLAHCREWLWFERDGRDGCNVLDVVHPLWLLSRQTGYRRAEIRDAVAGMLPDILADWVDGAGFAFEAGGEPGLQGTEMWLSIIYLAADLLDESDGLGWRPRGVHRLEPAERL
jgi:acetyltransferase-like isoleucine patch superfamily enzyme